MPSTQHSNPIPASGNGHHELLTPDNCAVLFIDHQPAMTFGVANIDRQTLINNVVGLAKAAVTFNVPVILTSVESASFSGAVWPQLTELFPGQQVIERSSMNSWEDAALVAAVKRTGRKKLVIAALWTEVCLAFPALCALGEGFEVYAVEDCSGGTSVVAHEAALARIQQAGGVRTTWVCTMLEWQRDWARRETYDRVMQTVIEVSEHSSNNSINRSITHIAYSTQQTAHTPQHAVIARLPHYQIRSTIRTHALCFLCCLLLPLSARRHVRPGCGVLLHDGAQGASIPQETGSRQGNSGRGGSAQQRYHHKQQALDGRGRGLKLERQQKISWE